MTLSQDLSLTEITVGFRPECARGNRCRMTFLPLVCMLEILLELGQGYNLDTFHPIIYRAPRGFELSYFGMSVAIRPRAAALKDSWAIQIGAPRGSGEGESAREPGTVFRCHSYGPCRRVAVEAGGADSVGGHGVYTYKQKKDGAWVGVATDIVDLGSYERSVVCGHRWMNEDLKNPENIDITYLMTGICYLQDLFNGTFHTPLQRLLPLLNRDKIYTPKPYVLDLSTYHWGLGQAGLSVDLADRSPDVLIGAPGVTHWIGSVVLYDHTLSPTVGHFATSQIASKNRYTYLGYAVASGKFYKDRLLWYVAGAPRSANYRGEVFTFQFKGSGGDVRLQSSLMGSSFGEYFGASLATLDLNGDSFDDLIVGAPLFSGKEADEGRIYVYLGTGRGNLLVPAQVVSGSEGGGRFGSCVSSMQDLDRDGYTDVAVGAPYEDERGAVYIYRGFVKGLQTEYSQRIRGSDINPHLRGFGVSISRAVDVDGNKYEDIAVGSYLSGHVVLLRSRPVISLHPSIRTDNISLVDRTASHFNFTLCSRYSGVDAPEFVDIVRVVDIDPVYGRGTLDHSTSAYRKTVRLRRNEIKCELHSVLLNLSRKNYSPMQLVLSNEISRCINAKGSLLEVEGQLINGKDEFPKGCPVGNKGEYSKEISFAGICGSDITCRSDLRLSCALPHHPTNSYIVGSSDPILLSIQLHNYGEPAYNTRIKIHSDINLHHRHHKGPASNTFWVDVGLLSDPYQTNFSFHVDIEALQLIVRPTRLNLIAQVYTSSLETNLNNNKCTLSLELSVQPHLHFFASSSLASLYVTESASHYTLNVTHYYEIQKTGLTPLKDAQLTIYIPFDHKTVLGFETETPEWMQVTDAFEATDGAKAATAFHLLPQPLPTNRTLFLNCSTPSTPCKVLNVFFVGGIPSGLSSYVKVLLSLNVTTTGLAEDVDVVQLSTEGVLSVWNLLEKGAREMRRSAALSIRVGEREVGVDGRLIGVSVLIGGFLLSGIVTGLVKRNFFRRAKKQELQALKDAEASFIYLGGLEKERGRAGGLPKHREVL